MSIGKSKYSKKKIRDSRWRWFILIGICIAMLCFPAVSAITRPDIAISDISRKPDQVNVVEEPRFNTDWDIEPEQPNQTPSKILAVDFTADPIQIYPDESSQVTVDVYDSDYNSVSGTEITLSANGGSISPSFGKSDSSGIFTAYFSASNPGTYTVTISKVTEPPGYLVPFLGWPTVTIEVIETSPNTVTISIEASPSTVTTGSPSVVMVRVMDSEYTPVQGVGITLDGGGGSLSATSGRTDANGEFTSNFQSANAGSYTIRIMSVTVPSGYESPAPPFGSTIVTVAPQGGTTNPPVTNPTYQVPDYTTPPTSSTTGRTGTVLVENIPPKAYFSVFPTGGEAPLNVSFDGTGSRDSDGYIKSWSWNFGDDQAGDGRQVSHVYQSPGVYTVTLLVKDNLAVSSSASQQVSITAKPATPVVNEENPPPYTDTTSQTMNFPPIVVALAVACLLAGLNELKSRKEKI